MKMIVHRGIFRDNEIRRKRKTFVRKVNSVVVIVHTGSVTHKNVSHLVEE